MCSHILIALSKKAGGKLPSLDGRGRGWVKVQTCLTFRDLPLTPPLSREGRGSLPINSALLPHKKTGGPECSEPPDQVGDLD